MDKTRNFTRRITRDDRIIKDFVDDLQRRKRPKLIMRWIFFMLEMKTLFIGKFVLLIDYAFYCVAYTYVFIKYYGNMKCARNNPDINTMLQ